MKKIIAYECDFCGKYLKTKKSIADHEKRCFKNPASKSCITCGNLCKKLFIGERQPTDKEKKILTRTVEGTYETKYHGDEYSYRELTSEYQYLNDAEDVDYCEGLNKKLDKLRTNCNHWEQEKQ